MNSLNPAQKKAPDPSEMTWLEWERNLKAYYASPRYKIATRKEHVANARLLAKQTARPADVDALALSELVAAEVKLGNKPPTINKKLRSLQRQVVMMMDLGILTVDPFKLVRMALPEDPEDYEIPQHLSLDQLDKVFQQADREAACDSIITPPWGSRLWRARRLRALLYIYAFCGIRKSEALNRKIDEVEFTDHADVAIVKIKRSVKTKASAQPVPLPQPGRDVIRDWIAFLQSYPTKTTWLFPMTRRPDQPWKGGASAYRPTEQLHALGVRAGVEHLTPLALRHSWATHAESAWGLSDLQIKRVLRHTNIRTQLHYRHVDLPNLTAIAGKVQFRIVRPDDDTPKSAVG